MSAPVHVGFRRALLRALREATGLDLALRLLAVALLLDTSLQWFERLPVLALAGTALLLPGMLRSRVVWGGLTLLTTAAVVVHWPFGDNHDYLQALACLAATSALLTSQPDRVFATSARWLVGLCFGFAALWKLGLSPDFVDGRFMRVTLLTDSRFEDLAVLAGPMTWERWEANGDLLRETVAGHHDWREGGFDEPENLRRFAWVATAYTGALEAWMALAFLWPRGRGLSRTRDAALLLFAITTYPFATVRGFGWVLMALGAGQSDRWPVRAAYLVTFVLIEAYRSVPWSEALVQSLGRG